MKKPVFDFYTYDQQGRDEIIPIAAQDMDEAYEVFRRVYGKEKFVDQIIKSDKIAVKSLMSGEQVIIDADTPWCCRPDSETYWSM